MKLKLSLKQKLVLIISLISLIYVGSLFLLYYSSKTIVMRNLEQNLVSSMDTLFKMLETNYSGVRDYREKETEVVKKKMLDTVDRLYNYADKTYKRVKKGEISLTEAKAIVWSYYLTIKIGQSGYVYILRDDGTCLLHPKEGVSGNNWNIKGKEYDFIRWQMTRVRGYKEYMWLNPGEIHLREKAIAQRYFRPFDWIISVSAYRHEFPLLVDISFTEKTKKNLEDTIRSLTFGKTGYSFCMSPNYVLVVHPKQEEQNIKNTPVGQLMGDPTKIERSRKETVVLYYKWINPGEKEPSNKVLAFRYFSPYDWVVGMTAYPDEYVGGIYDIMLKTGIIVAPALLLCTLLLFLFISRSIINPITTLTKTVEKYSKGDMTVRSAVNTSDEIGFLSAKFNLMLDQLQAALQQLIKKVEEKYHHIFENAVEGIYQSSPDGRILVANPALAKMLGYQSPAELVAEITDIDNQLYVDKAEREAISRQLKESGIARGFECRYYQKEGRIIWVKKNIRAITEAHGQVLYFEGTIEDITERKRAEAALKESELLFASIIEFLPDATMAINKEGKVIVWNKALEEMTGVKVGDVLGKGQYEYSLAFYGQRRPILVDLVLASDEATEKKYLYVKKERDIFIGEAEAFMNGKTRYLWGKASPLRDSKGNIIGAIEAIRDMTERRFLETQVLRSQKMEAIGTLAGGIAHDFNNLLMGIKGYTFLISTEGTVNITQSDYLQKIDSCVESATDLTRQLLGFARKGKYIVKPTDINDILKKTSDMFGRTRKEISIHPRYQENIWLMEVDQGQMEQVFMNLYLNALQAMPAGGDLFVQTENIILDEKDMDVLGLHPGKYVKISVKDTGIGMDKNTQQRIFEPFFTTKEMGRGTGLGLASAYGIIKSHSGTINVQSEPGKGATFTIYLPATKKILAKVPVKELQSSVTLDEAKGTILLIDDEGMILQVNKMLIEKLGYNVLAAASGPAAIKIYQENYDRIDLVILDMIMPEMSGEKTYDELKKINPRIKVILCSGYSINGKAEEIMRRGMESFIQKPFNIPDLSKLIKTILDRK